MIEDYFQKVLKNKEKMVGNRTSMTLASGDTVYYEYDGIYQLTKEDRRASDDSLVYINYFEYDLAGNRTHLHYVDSGTDDWTYYTYNIENQLTIEEKAGSATYYTYNPVGELIGKKVGEDEYSYEYTYEGQMNVFSDGAVNAYYTYDSNFRRVEKKVDGVKTKFEYSDSDVVAEYDDNDALAATFNTPELDQNLTVKISDAVYHYLQDGLGSIRNLIDSSETIQNAYDYLAFGSLYGTPTENISNPYRFTGRHWDSESSLHFYRTRMYNQLLGRFTAKDPLAMQSGTNRYLYVGNRSVLLSDPMGLFTVMFKGFWYPGKVFNTVLENAENLIKGKKPQEEVLILNDWGLMEAFGNIIIKFMANPTLAKCMDINIVGYSCGADSALSLARMLDTTAKFAGWDLEVKNLIYLDFNWGTTHWFLCQHLTGQHYDIPPCVKSKYHKFSQGTMTDGLPDWPLQVVTNIVTHTGLLWLLAPDPWITWQQALRLIQLGFMGKWWELGLPLINTSGYWTKFFLSEKYGWPKGGIIESTYESDHLQMGKDSPKVSDWIANIIGA